MKRIPIPRQILPIIALVALAVAVFFVVTTQPNRALTKPANTPPTVPGAQAKSGAVSGAGVVEPSSELIEVGAQRAGVVTNVVVQAGDRVSKGQLLFTIDDRDAQARLREARAAAQLARERIDSARVDVSSAQRLLNLYTSVEDPRAVAEQQVIDRRAARDQAAARLEVARAEYEQAQAQVASAQTTAGLHQVRAPRSATVLQVRTRAGEYATAGPGPGNTDPLMVLGETQPLYVRIDVDESEIDRAALGQPAVVSPRGNSGRRVRAGFVRIEPLVVPKRSLTNDSAERVDVRVLQLVYALTGDAGGFFVEQQVDAFIQARGREPAGGRAAQ